jgi:hypothetical protein
MILCWWVPKRLCDAGRSWNNCGMFLLLTLTPPQVRWLSPLPCTLINSESLCLKFPLNTSTRHSWSSKHTSAWPPIPSKLGSTELKHTSSLSSPGVKWGGWLSYHVARGIYACTRMGSWFLAAAWRNIAKSFQTRFALVSPFNPA